MAERGSASILRHKLVFKNLVPRGVVEEASVVCLVARAPEVVQNLVAELTVQDALGLKLLKVPDDVAVEYVLEPDRFFQGFQRLCRLGVENDRHLAVQSRHHLVDPLLARGLYRRKLLQERHSLKSDQQWVDILEEQGAVGLERAKVSQYFALHAVQKLKNLSALDTRQKLRQKVEFKLEKRR